jgi:hypothetical protein
VKVFISPGDGSIVSVDDVVFVGPIQTDKQYGRQTIQVVFIKDGVQHTVENKWERLDNAQQYQANMKSLLGIK